MAKNYYDKAIIERIIFLRNKHFGSRGKSNFARALDISASTYNYYEKDRVPPIDILLKICEVTGADINWLLKGQKSEKYFALGQNRPLLSRLEELLADNADMAKAVEAFVELLCRHKEIQADIQGRQAPTKPEMPGWIPVLGRTAAGIIHFWDQSLFSASAQAVTELENLVKKHIGKDLVSSTDTSVSVDLQLRLLIDALKTKQAELIQVCGQEPQQIAEFVHCEEIRRLFPDSFALRIDGDSMSPRINDGNVVILSPSVPAAQGQIAVARIANQIGVTCKLIRTTQTDVHLIPINERYETRIVAQKDLLWALAVLCHISI